MNRLLLMTIAGALVGGCGPGSGPTLTIGAVFSTTGALSGIGTVQLESAQLAVEEINANGGVDGHQLVLVNRDDATDATRGATAAGELVELDVPVVIGAVGSAITLAVHDVLRPAGIVQISASSTSPLITTAADDGLLFRTCPSDALQGKLLANRAYGRGHRNVAIIHLPGAYGAGLADAFEAAFETAGGAITSKVQYAEGEPGYSDVLTSVYSTSPKPEAILLVAYPVDGAQIITDYRLGFAAESTFWYFTDATQDAAFITAVGPDNFTFFHEGSGPHVPTGSADYQAFATAYETRYGKAVVPGTFAANAYDAVFLAALAMEASGERTSAGIKGALPAVSAGGTGYGPATYGDAVAAARQGADVDFRGASGPVDLDAEGDALAPYDIWDISAGAIRVKESGVSP